MKMEIRSKNYWPAYLVFGTTLHLTAPGAVLAAEDGAWSTFLTKDWLGVDNSNDYNRWIRLHAII
jgi:hypothetical protein